MPRPARTDEFVEIFHREGGNLTAVARIMGLSRAGVQHYARKTGLQPSRGTPAPKAQAKRAPKLDLPPKGEVRRFILTCAQSCTPVWRPAWRSLTALADHYGAELKVSRFTYNQNHFGPMAVKPGRTKPYEHRLWYADEIAPYASDEAEEIAPGLIWCGDLNILPTAVDPLSALDNYTGAASTVVPHTKMRMVSVATPRAAHAKLMYTTGSVTKQNYVEKKAGQKARFHHVYGGLLVEVDHDGNWFARQLNADKSGVIYDLDLRATPDGEITRGNPVEAINWGDMHTRHLDPEVARLGWGGDGDDMVSVLAPRYHVVNDLLDQYARNPHDRKDCHRMFRRHVEGWDSVRDEVEDASALLLTLRETAEVVVVNSNHDEMLRTWLRDADYRLDPKNAITFLSLQLAMYRAIESGAADEFHLLEHACREAGAPASVRFLRDDESFTLCGSRIEVGMHGHLGANGAKGTPRGLSKMGVRVNTGHTHSAAIENGVYVAGTSSRLQLIYNHGPSSWSHSHVVTYRNGKRAIITMWRGKWRA